jgi:hypothetical protein
MKYHIDQKHKKHLAIALAPWGRVRELVGGILIALPWVLVGMTLFFLPDYIGAYSKSDALTHSFVGFALVVLVSVVVAVGYRRAFRDIRFDFDGRTGKLERLERSFFGAKFGSSVPLDSVVSVRLDRDLGGHRAVLVMAAGDEHVVARAWFGPDEVHRIAGALADVIGAKRVGFP